MAFDPTRIFRCRAPALVLAAHAGRPALANVAVRADRAREPRTRAARPSPRPRPGVEQENVRHPTSCCRCARRNGEASGRFLGRCEEDLLDGTNTSCG